MLEKIVINARRFLLGISLLTAVSCGKDTIVNIPNDDGNRDTRHIGSIKGVVAVPNVREGNIVWEGLSGANVWLINTNFSDKTTFGGWYSIDSIPDNNYAVTAVNSQYFPDTMGAVVEKQQKVTADTLRLLPKYNSGRILRGTVYDGNGYPFRNQEIIVSNLSCCFEGDKCDYLKDYGKKLTTFITNNQGGYALQNLGIFNGGDVFFQTPNGKILRINSPNGDCVEPTINVTDEPINTLDLYTPN